MSLHLIIGPMFSGKTTELIRQLYTYKSIYKKCLYVNSILDSREDKDFSTHNSVINNELHIKSLKVRYLNDNFLKVANKYDIIGIDESQLFGEELVSSVNLLVDNNKKVIISGLNSDFRKQKFGHILDLVPNCDTIIKLFPYCVCCAKSGKEVKALFSKRISGGDKVVDIGYNNYIPVCRKCSNN